MPQPSKEIVLSKVEVGRRIRAARLACEMTQAQLAGAIGTHAPNVSSIERGLRGVSLQQVIRLSKALRVSPAEILGANSPGKAKSRPLSPRLVRRIERVQALPRSKQQSLLDWLDAYLDKHATGNGHR